MTPQNLLLAICILTVAALTAGGMAMRSVSRIWLRHWVEQQLRGSRAALAYLERPQRLIIASSSASSCRGRSRVALPRRSPRCCRLSSRQRLS
jgi:hypothetical protein